MFPLRVIVPGLSWCSWVFSSLDGWSLQTLVLMSFPSLNGQSFWALVFESFPWLMFTVSVAIKFIFSPAMYYYSFYASIWWNWCIPMSFVFLVGISTHVKGYVGFAIGIWSGQGGIGGGFPLVLSGSTLFLVKHTGLAPFPVLNFFPDINFTMCLVMASLRSCVWKITCYALCRQSLKNNP